MKIIKRTTTYWLLKPLYDGSTYYYIRCDGVESGYYWFIGHENHLGGVSVVAGDLKEEEIKKLEDEFQKTNTWIAYYERKHKYRIKEDKKRKNKYLDSLL